MSTGVPTRLVAAVLGLAGLAIALIGGLAVDNPADVVLTRALVAMVICHIAGWILGFAAERTVQEALVHYRKANPAIEEKPKAPVVGAGEMKAVGT